MDTIDSSSFKISMLQATIFTPDQDHTTSKTMSKFYPMLSEIFDADPEVIPNLTGFPPEVPRITLKNKLNSLKAEIAAVRFNIFGRALKEDDSEDHLDDFYKKASQIFCKFKDIIECRIGRLAAVRTVYAYHDTPGLYLARHFCKETWDEAPLNRPENFELHAHKVFLLSETFKVNSWARSKTGHFLVGDTKSQIILFEQDINTLAEEEAEKAFGNNDIEEFFTSVEPEFQKMLELYYPSSVGE